jgi:glycosyltransferase involved in cell wall biosynthesis
LLDDLISTKASAAPMRVCLDARLVSGERGGVEQVIIGLADGLSRLTDASDEYLFLVDREHTEWLKPYVGGPCRMLESEDSPLPGRGRFLGGRGHRTIARMRRRLGRPAADRRFGLGPADPAVERAGADLMHFTMQVGFRTSIPSIFQPQDLQHLHLPEFFSPETLAERNVTYRELCDQATVVVANSRWGKEDLVAGLGLPDEKVQIIPYAPVIQAYAQPSDEDVADVRTRLGLPETFALYPAKAWPHKNHVRLLEALRILRDERGLVVPVVLTGHQGGFDIPVREAASTLGLSEQVIFTGFVDPMQFRSLYRLARLLVFPSLFEGWGMPILEAFAAELPVACSNVTCLPDVTAGAARLFDPRDPAEIAAAIGDLWTDESKRVEMAHRGLARASLFSWDRTASMFRAHYRRLTERRLTENDLAILQAEALV